MSVLHDPNNPRYKRLFDLMRQKSCAASLSGRKPKIKVVELDEDTARQLKDRAFASLRHGDLVSPSRKPDPGRK